ncbi:MAG: glutamate racemase [Flavobacteriaceae bacterium]|nr:glutamate racemase [Flavobacteriaceae bacterium]
MNNKPIGIFDSGIGGLSIWKEIITFLPNENTIYLADSNNAPYGQKSKQEIIDLCIKNTKLLLKNGCKIIVIACNTATTNAINYLRKNYDVPFIGIEPAIKPAALKTKTKKIGILATKGTLNSELFSKNVAKFTSDIKIIEQIGEGLVPLIETGKINSIALTVLLKNHLCNLVKKDIDYLVLGCSHYSFLIPQIQKIIGTKIKIIDSGEAVAKQTKVVLKKFNLINTKTKFGKHQLFSNLDESRIKDFIKNENYKINFLNF